MESHMYTGDGSWGMEEERESMERMERKQTSPFVPAFKLSVVSLKLGSLGRNEGLRIFSFLLSP